MVKLFIYGTLKPGFLRWNQIEKYVKETKRANIYATMFDLGSYPAVCLDPTETDIVTGYVVVAEDEILEVCDQIEGVSRDLYKRGTCKTYDNHKMDYAFIYHMDYSKLCEMIPVDPQYSRVKGGIWTTDEGTRED